MTGFFLKKNLYDGWDNVLTLLAINALLLVVNALFLFGALSLSSHQALAWLLLSLAWLVTGGLLAAVSAECYRVASFKSFSWKSLVSHLKTESIYGILCAALSLFAALILLVSVPWYARWGNGIGLAFALVLIWIALVVILSLQWFYPIRSQLKVSFIRSVQKCFVIFFDNPGLSLFMALYSLLCIFISLITLFLLPGFSGLILAYNEAFRLLLYKYDWAEAHPLMDWRVARKQVPWDDLLAHDEETLGDRSFKHFIFPWKN